MIGIWTSPLCFAGVLALPELYVQSAKADAPCKDGACAYFAAQNTVMPMREIEALAPTAGRANQVRFVASVPRRFPIGIIGIRRWPYLAVEALANRRADRAGLIGPDKRLRRTARPDSPEVMPAPSMLLDMHMPAGRFRLGQRNHGGHQQCCRTYGQCRPFEVPAPQAANSVQELQMENRHWNR
jgi:hypothetical protein